MKTIVVAGGAGFIGSHLCDFLVKEGSKVICVDNFITGSKKNVSHLLENKNFVFLEADISKPFDLDAEKIDQIYNLASPASPVDFFRYSIEILLVNSLGNLNLLNLALKHNADFLFTSTSEVYGDPKEVPQKESYWGNVNPIGVRSAYDESKRFGEALVTAFNRRHSKKAKIVRIFNTYGPRMREGDGRVIPSFISQALSGKPITVFGSGKQTRSFCFVSDMVSGLHKMMNSGETGPINLGNPKEFKIIEAAKKIKALTKSSSRIVFGKKPEDDPERRKPDISKARKLLKFEPKIGLEEGLKTTIDYFKSLSR